MLRNAGMTGTRTCMAALATGPVAAGGAVAVVMAVGEVKGHRRHTLHSWQRIACMLRTAGMTGTRTCMAALATGQVAVAAGGAVAVVMAVGEVKGHRRHTLHSWQRIACMLRN